MHDRLPQPSLPLRRVVSACDASASVSLSQTHDAAMQLYEPVGSRYVRRIALSLESELSDDYYQERSRACAYLMEGRSIRKKYHHYGFLEKETTKQAPPSTSSSSATTSVDDSSVSGFSMRGGVVRPLRGGEELDGASLSGLLSPPSLAEFADDFERLTIILADGPTRTFSHQRMDVIMRAFEMHTNLNHRQEELEQTMLPRDFFQVAKVDNHIHLAAGMPVQDFSRFIQEKARDESDTVVEASGRTLGEVLREANLDVSSVAASSSDDDAEKEEEQKQKQKQKQQQLGKCINVDRLEVMADFQTFQRFDKFNSKYSPFKSQALRRVFLKTDNFLQGRFFAEICQKCTKRLEDNGTTFAEYRVSVYGSQPDEWLKLSRWLLGKRSADFQPSSSSSSAPKLPSHDCLLSDHVRWQIQIPRIWSIVGGNTAVYKPDADASSRPPTFADCLANIFVPLFAATLAPEAHPEVAEALKHVGGFDSVDDESRAEVAFEACRGTEAGAWAADGRNPHYAWQLYHLWANVAALNSLRRARGLNEFSLRPHAGETGPSSHLAAAYALARGINHGIQLKDAISLRFLYYLDQVGLSVAPVSNDFLFLRFAQNPLARLHAQGLNVTLSTDVRKHNSSIHPPQIPPYYRCCYYHFVPSSLPTSFASISLFLFFL